MPDFVETLAYRAEGGLPWHGLGNPVANDMTTDDMLDAAGLRFTVSKQPLYFPTAQEGGKWKMKVVPDEFALIRDDSQMVLDTVGSNFKPVQNADVMAFFKRFVEAGDMQLETAGSLKGGRFVWALARINESFTVGKEGYGDETRGYVLLSQPHQFGYSMTAALTPVRVVCWNTINAALGTKLDGTGGSNSASFRMVHSRAFDDNVKAEAERALGLAHDGMKAFGHTAEMLSEVGAKDDDLTEYFHQVLRIEQEEPEEGEEDADEHRNVKRFRESLISAPGAELPTAKGTWWGAFQATTHTVDHVLGRTQDNRLYSAWYGRGSTIKRRALELAVDFAKAA